MSSLFLRMFLAFCAATVTVVSVVVAGFIANNPDQLPFAWPRVGRGAILSSGRTAIESYERGGRDGLARYLKSLQSDTGLRGALFDTNGRELSGTLFPPDLQRDLRDAPEEQVIFRIRDRVAAVRVQGYTFLANVPRREGFRILPRTFLITLILTAGVLCFLLARHVTAPVVQLRALTSRFSSGDLTARVTSPAVLERNDELGGLSRDFNQMAWRIESLMKAQQRLIADVSHELRSPITRLTLALGLLRRHTEPESRVSLVRIQREVDRLNALITQLLTLSRLESLAQPPPMERIDLAAMVREIASDADFEAGSMDCSVELAETAPAAVFGAPELLRSAVENVVRNAVKYTVAGTAVTIRLLAPATILVEDHGPGVPPHELDHMFEPFYRVSEARDRASGGAGLGLAIARQIVTLHHGTIRARNRESGGLEMTITLPAAPNQ